MRRFTLATLIFLGTLLLSLAAQATPVTISVDGWQTSDGNFSFSAFHGATSAATTRDGATYWRSGSIDFNVNPPGELSGDLTGEVLSSVSGLVALDGAGTILLDGMLDFSVADGDLIGTLDYELTTGGGAHVETGTFYFFNYAFSSGTCDANDLCGDVYRLWGNNWDNQAADAGLLKPDDNVMVSWDGGASFVMGTEHRGVDLGGMITLVPEPHAAVLFAVGLSAAGISIRETLQLMSDVCV